MESDTMELLRLMLAHLRPRLQGRDEEWQALERKQQELDNLCSHSTHCNNASVLNKSTRLPHYESALLR